MCTEDNLGSLRINRLLRLLRLLRFLRYDRNAVPSKFLSWADWRQYWADWRLCLSARLAPFRTPCARMPAPFQEQPAVPSPMGLTEVDGGMSTVLP